METKTRAGSTHQRSVLRVCMKPRAVPGSEAKAWTTKISLRDSIKAHHQRPVTPEKSVYTTFMEQMKVHPELNPFKPEIVEELAAILSQVKSIIHPTGASQLHDSFLTE